MSVIAAALITLTSIQEPPKTHPAFVHSVESLEKVWQKGFNDAKSKREPWGYVDRLRRGIGSIRTGPLRSETVSFLWMFTPEVLAYTQGFSARKGYWSESEVQASKAMISSILRQKPQLTFMGQLSIQPSFGGFGATIDRTARPTDLTGVRVVLKIGERIYQPRTQPGDLEMFAGTGTSTVDRTVVDTSTTETRGSVSGGGATYSVSGRSTTNNYYTVREHENYRYFEGHFVVEFDLITDTGEPIVSPVDREFEVIVIYGPNERRAKYRLSDIASMKN